MEKQLSSLYRLGGLTGILSGLLMVASSIWFIFGLSSISSDPSAEHFGRIGIFHGIGVVTIILLVPTLLASYGLLSSEAAARSALGASMAVLWLVIELVAPLFTNCANKCTIGISRRSRDRHYRRTLPRALGRVGRSPLYDRRLPLCIVSTLLWLSTPYLGKYSRGIPILSCDNSLSSRYFPKP